MIVKNAGYGSNSVSWQSATVIEDYGNECLIELENKKRIVEYKDCMIPEIKSRVQLVELMKHNGAPLIAVELGVAEGIFATELLSLGLERLYLIDVWEHTPSIPGCASLEQSWHDKNFKQVLSLFKNNPKAVILPGLTTEMAKEFPDNSLGLVYVDADHSYEGTLADIETYYPKLVDGGILAVHDFANEGYGVGRAVQEFTKGEGIVVLKEGEDINNWGAYFIKK